MSQVTAVRDYKKRTYSFIFGISDESKEAVIDPSLGVRGEVIKLVVTIPNWTAADITTVVSLINEDDKEVFVTSSMVENDEYDITLNDQECIIMGQTDEKWKVTLSGAPGGTGGTVVLTAYVRG